MAVRVRNPLPNPLAVKVKGGGEVVVLPGAEAELDVDAEQLARLVLWLGPDFTDPPTKAGAAPAAKSKKKPARGRKSRNVQD